MDDLLTVKEVAEMLGVEEHHVYNAIRARTEERRLHALRIFGHGLRIKRSEVERFRRANLCPVDVEPDAPPSAD
jgi:excisionase family DNA binding protein